MIVNACPNRLKSFAIQLAVNALAGSIPAAFLVLVGIRNVDVARSLVVGIVFANAIGFPASFVIPRLYPRVASRGPAWEWSIITLVLVGLAILGCLVGTAVIVALGIFPWSQY